MVVSSCALLVNNAIVPSVDGERQLQVRRSDNLVHSLPRFDGATYDAGHDCARLTNQLARVYGAMLDGRWRTLGEIAAITQDPESSVSARLRDLRKPRFGGFSITRRRRGPATRGLFEYQLQAQHTPEPSV